MSEKYTVVDNDTIAASTLECAGKNYYPPSIGGIFVAPLEIFRNGVLSDFNISWKRCKKYVGIWYLLGGF